MVETVEELPQLLFAAELFLDVETQRVYDGLYPWKGDRICGVGVTINDDPQTWYIPVRHTVGERYNIPIEAFQKWLKDTVWTAQAWINHNLPIDAVFCHFDGATWDKFTGRAIDTLTLSKVHDSDRFGHGLKQLCREWLGMEMSEEREIKAYLDGIKSKSYADVPPDKLGAYAGMDVIANRKLYRFLQANRPPRDRTDKPGIPDIWETEIGLQAGLIDIEIRGLQANRNELRLEQRTSLSKTIQWCDDVARVTGREFTNSNQCKYDMLINRLQLPVLATKWEKDEYTGRRYDTGRPTFDKKAMALYEVHPHVTSSKKATFIVKNLRALATEGQYQGLFLIPFQELMDDDQIIHPTYNPVVRTGRMSCKRPNSQQQNKRSKKLIHPRKGYGFISCDYSQIEYRLIAHYTNDPDTIRAYNENPDIDYHQWVADLIGVTRKAGKTLNFGMAYGAGKKKVESELAANPDIIAHVSEMITDQVKAGGVSEADRDELFHQMCKAHAAKVYQAYHEKMPGIRRTAKEADIICRRRGYIFNAYGRRRHLPQTHAHKAFNSLVQGCAMDLIKERMLYLMPRYNAWMRERDIHIVANVHDEVLFEVPEALLLDRTVHDYLIQALETPTIKFRVPIRVGLGVSKKHWAEAAGDDAILSDGRVIDRSKAELPEGAEVVAGKLR
jgi:DNA polymerase-1